MHDAGIEGFLMGGVPYDGMLARRAGGHAGAAETGPAPVRGVRAVSGTPSRCGRGPPSRR
jgi:hypothetical protein